MKNYQYQDDGLPCKNPWHTAIIWCGTRFSKRWRRMIKHINFRLEIALERDPLQVFDFDCAYEQATGTLAFVLMAILTDTLCQWPIGDGTRKWMLAQIDWQAIATRILDEHWSNYGLTTLITEWSDEA
jgi:hypothetical protein